MTQMYGSLWINSYGESANENQAWRIGISGLTQRQVDIGLAKTATSGKTFPPTLPEFLAYCKGSKYEFNRIYETCVYWSNDDELKRRGLEKTREVLFIMRLIGSDLREARNGQAEKIVQRGIDALEKHLATGGELPEFLVEIDEFPQGEKKGFSLASFQEMLAEG